MTTMQNLKIVVFKLFMLALVTNSVCPAEEKVKLATGEYAVTRSAGKPEIVGTAIDHWTLWKLKDGNLLAEIRLAGPGGDAVQEFLFTPAFKPIGYGLSGSAKPRDGENTERHVLSCKLLPQLIRCKTDKDSVELA